MPPPRSRPVARGRPSTVAPVYQPPENPLSPQAQQSLASLKRLHQLTSVEKHLKDANQLLADCVFEANKILADREQNVEKRRAKAERDGVEHNAREQAELEQRQKAVRKLNTDMDTRTRKVIDEQYAVDYIKQSLEDAARMAGNAPNLPTSQAASFDPTMPDAPSQPESGPPPSEFFKRGVQAKMDGWQQMALQTRYSHHPDYVSFKKLSHDGAHGDHVPMQPASRWFGPPRGSPAPGTTRGHAADDSDDDIIIARETISTKCPITLTELKNPIMNKHCRHVFEKEAIMQMTARSEINCPTTGCNKVDFAVGLGQFLVLTRMYRKSPGRVCMSIRLFSKRSSGYNKASRQLKTLKTIPTKTIDLLMDAMQTCPSFLMMRPVMTISTR